MKGERIRFQVRVRTEDGETVSVRRNGEKCEVSSRWEGGILVASCDCEQGGMGEQSFEVCLKDKSLHALFYVSENLKLLSEKRCHFIARNQQYHGRAGVLCGAYLIYDNEEQRVYYDHKNDYNGGRGRIFYRFYYPAD